MAPTVAYFGTYDPVYPRNRVLIDGLRSAGTEVLEFSAPLPQALDAATMATPVGAGKLACELARAHLRLLRRHRRGARFDVVVVGYPGHLAMPLARAVAAYRRALLVFDPLVSLHDTFAGDRELVAPRGAVSRTVAAIDRTALRLADLVLADTDAQAAYYRSRFELAAAKVAVVPVGAAPVPDATGAARKLAPGEPLTVLQYGKWSPLHGAETVLAAAAELRDEPFRFVLIGEGQVSAALRAEIGRRGLANVEMPGMGAASELRREVTAADVCLGVFGSSEKAARVIPNKVYDGLAAGRPVVTRDSTAARELLTDGETALLVPAGDGPALAAALRGLLVADERERLGAAALRLWRERCSPAVLGARLLSILEDRR